MKLPLAAMLCLLVSVFPLAASAQYRVYVPGIQAGYVQPAAPPPTPTPIRHWAKGVGRFGRASDFAQIGSTDAVT